MNLGAFLVVTWSMNGGSFDLNDYAGLYRRSPLLTLLMAFCLLSLVGLPCRVSRQAVRVRGRDRAGHGDLRHDRRRQRRDRRLLLLQGPEGDDDRPGQRGEAAAASRARRPGLARVLPARQRRAALLLGAHRGLGPRRARALRGPFAADARVRHRGAARRRRRAVGALPGRAAGALGLAVPRSAGRARAPRAAPARPRAPRRRGARAPRRGRLAGDARRSPAAATSASSTAARCPRRSRRTGWPRPGTRTARST